MMQGFNASIPKESIHKTALCGTTSIVFRSKIKSLANKTKTDQGFIGLSSH